MNARRQDPPDPYQRVRERNARLKAQYKSDFLGGGTYGWVLRKGSHAVKCFEEVKNLIQEWAALKYLQGCEHVISGLKVDFDRKEITMPLYETTLDHWLKTHLSAKLEVKMGLLRDILYGLVEIHDRHLTHGDLKPDNCLVNFKNGTPSAVIADCGFLSVSKYSRTDLTTGLYQEPAHNNDKFNSFKNYYHHPSHDIYSYALIFVEVLVGQYALRFRTKSYQAVTQGVEQALRGQGYEKYVKSVLAMLDPDISRRWTARQAMSSIFKFQLPESSFPYTPCNSYTFTSEDFSLPKDRKNLVRHEIMKYNLVLNRCYIGYKALCAHLKTKKVKPELDVRYGEALVVILYSLFRTRDFAIRKEDLLKNRHFVLEKPHWDKLVLTLPRLLGIVAKLMTDEMFISILLQRSCTV